MEKTTRKAQKEQTKTALLSAAYELYSQRGFINTRMSDIAEAAGVSHGTVFLHFNSQEELITQVIDIYCGRIAQRTHELADSGASLRQVLSAHLNTIAQFEPFYTRLVIENHQLPSSARDTFINLQSAIAFHFSLALGGEHAPNVPPALLFNMWTGLVHHYLCNFELFAPEGKVLERYAHTLIESFMTLIKGK